MIKYFKKLFKIEKFRLVRTIEIHYNMVDNLIDNNIEESHIMFCHLYESDIGSRKVKNISTSLKHNSKPDIMAESFTEYQRTIIRWLAGRHDPDIPSYNDIPEEDTISELRGKI